jgi:ATP-dependent Clp protease ATP-binding subunit ClpC
MFERYDENARRAVFFARYEASQSGSSQIGSLHLLLGILRESGTLFTLADDSISVNDLIEDCRRALPDHGEKTSTSVDMPLSSECSQALADALMQAEIQASRFVQPLHLVLGLITASKDVAAILSKHGITAKKLSREPTGDLEKPAAAASPSAVMEFLCQGERVASTPVNFTNPLPRAGDEVVFSRDSNTETYKVLRVQHHYEGPPLTKTLAHCWLVKLIVETERIESAPE